jgi:threonine/homoserine/homoserine lactone efflux protein
VAGEPDVAQAARNLADSLARLKQDAVNFGVGKIEGARHSAEAEVRRRIVVVAGACAALLFIVLAIVFAGVAVILAFADTHPALAAAGVAVGYLLLAGLAAWLMARAHRRRPKALGQVASLAGLLLRLRRAVR